MRNWYHSRRKKLIRHILLGIFSALLVISLFLLGRYFVEAASTRQLQQELAETYHNGETSSPLSPQETHAPEDTASALPSSTPAAPADAGTASPEEEASDLLQPVVYPLNPHGLELFTFESIRKTNPDIVAWLQADETVDSAVVLRDNTYYLTHDASGKENSNGALFLDESTVFNGNLRPSTFIVYGHNMKTGAMFGSLRRYESGIWYYEHPFLTFNTMYEDGDYVIFSVATVNVEDQRSPAYVNLYDLNSDFLSTRLSCMQKLQSRSSYANQVSLSGDDQILLLVTCNGNDAERLVISARRFRDGETRETVRQMLP